MESCKQRSTGENRAKSPWLLLGLCGLCCIIPILAALVSGSVTVVDWNWIDFPQLGIAILALVFLGVGLWLRKAIKRGSSCDGECGCSPSSKVS